MTTQRRFKQWLFIAGGAGLLVAAWFVLEQPQPEEVEAGSVRVAASASPNTAEGAGTPDHGSRVALDGESRPSVSAPDPFREWVARYQRQPGDSPERRLLFNEGIRQAKERALRMEMLIREDPQRAIAEGLRFDEWQSLPEVVQVEVERPFSTLAPFSQYTVCHNPATPVLTPESAKVAVFTMPDGTDIRFYSYGRREGVFSKASAPVQGVMLRGVAAVRDGPLQILEAGEVQAAKQMFESGQADMQRCLLTGKSITGAPVHVVSGGKIFSLASRAEALALDDQLAELDALPGPWSASPLLASPEFATSDGRLDLSGLAAYATASSSSWTLTRKRLFLIRINFPDKPAEPVTQVAAQTAMDAASGRIREMSYGQTWVESTASANVYTMPKSFAYYSDGNVNDRFFTELMRDARNTFRRSKSGADAAVNIGPESNVHEGGQSGLGDYDIVGIFRTNLPGEGGVAGGPSLFMMANDERIYVHEWGHNYGLGHASWWEPSGPEPVGAGQSDEYGDRFDVMGNGPLPAGHFHPQGKALLGWLSPEGWVDATARGAGVYRIFAIDDPATASGVRGLRVTQSGPAGEYFWVGYRPNAVDNRRTSGGAYLIWQRPGENRSWLVDTTPGTSGSRHDSCLGLGATFSLPNGQAHLTPVATGGAGTARYLDVRVNLGTFAGNRAPTAGEIEGPSVVSARQPADFRVAGADADGDALAFQWVTGDRTPEILPNATAIRTHWVVGGTYSLQVTVSDMKGGRVTKSKEIQVVDPLDNWSETNVGRPVTLLSARAGNGSVVAAAGWGEIFQSWDGINWSEVKRTAVVNHDPRLAFGGGRFVLAGRRHDDVARTARFEFSQDGRLWEAASVPAGWPFPRAVAHDGGKFVAVGDGGTVFRSGDGKNWSVGEVPGRPDFRELAWHGSHWMATAINPAKINMPDEVWTSADGVNWTRREARADQTGPIIGQQGVFHAMCWGNSIMRSVDSGASWTYAPMPGDMERWETSARQVTVAADGTMLAYGLLHGYNDPIPLVSSDGRSWHWSTSPAASEALRNVWPDQLSFGGGRFLRLGENGVVKYSGLLDARNSAPSLVSAAVGPARARSPVTIEATAADSDGNSLHYFWDFGPQWPIVEGAQAQVVLPFGGSYNAVLRVVDGNGGITTTNFPITVPDAAVSFTTRPSGSSFQLRAIATNSNIAVAVGDANHPVITSTNGSNWVQRSVPSFTYMQDVTWDGVKFIAVGHSWLTNAWRDVVHVSGNGINWTNRYVSEPVSSGRVRTVAAGPGAGAVAAGENGFFLRSADGLTWTTANIPLLGSMPVRDMAWGPPGFVMNAVAYGAATTNKILISPDGINWTDRTSGAGLEEPWKHLTAVFRLNNRFVASGPYSGIRTSTNGGASFAIGQSRALLDVEAAAYGNGVYFGAGWDRDRQSASVDVFSLNGMDWYSFDSGTANPRLGAAFFRGTFITVGEKGEIRQSGLLSPPLDIFAVRTVGPVMWDGVESSASRGFLTAPNTKAPLYFTHDLALPWQLLGEVESNGLGQMEAVFRGSGDRRPDWGRRMFFRLGHP
jgi:hypothetical protein